MVYQIFLSLICNPWAGSNPLIPTWIAIKGVVVDVSGNPAYGSSGPYKGMWQRAPSHCGRALSSPSAAWPHAYYYAITCELTLFNRSLRWQGCITGNGDIEFETWRLHTRKLRSGGSAQNGARRVAGVFHSTLQLRWNGLVLETSSFGNQHHTPVGQKCLLPEFFRTGVFIFPILPARERELAVLRVYRCQIPSNEAVRISTISEETEPAIVASCADLAVWYAERMDASRHCQFEFGRMAEKKPDTKAAMR